MKWTVALAVIGLTLVAAENAKDDKEQIQGTWAVTEAQVNGEMVNDPGELRALQTMKLSFKGDTVINSNAKEIVSKFQLNAAKTPRTLDIVMVKKDMEVKMLLLYELQGDTLKICFAKESGIKRPQEFTSKGEQLILTMKREKP
jgi:uncharacterized protein (TIGR03067 family)